jgi:hypothetical protein
LQPTHRQQDGCELNHDQGELRLGPHGSLLFFALVAVAAAAAAAVGAAGHAALIQI